MTNRILVGGVFLAGCAVGGASSQLVVPKASAQQQAQLTKWEYACVDKFEADALNQYGAQGWELAASVSEPRFGGIGTCFKRPKM